jgi:heat shock protein HslJ/uncharacterized protein YraI
MENQEPKNGLESQTLGNPEKKDSKNTLIIILLVVLAIAVVSIVFLLVAYVFNNNDSPGDDGAISPPIVTVDATLVPPTPEPGDPVARVIARAGVNVRTGPSLAYPVIGLAPFGTESKVVGKSADDTWWVVDVPVSLNGHGWVSDEYVAVERADNVMVIPAPPTPTPVATPTATATPAPEISFNANRTTINAGEKATLNWSVDNVAAVYMYPVGDRFENYPVTGQGSRDVQPYITTSYELLTFKPDNTTSSQRIEITVFSGLTNGRWVLESYSTPTGGSKTPLPGTELTARFGADGSLSGSGGCNNYSGAFMAFDETLRMTNLTSSQNLCPEPTGVMEQEGTFLNVMNQASKMTISAGQLAIYDSNGNRILVFRNG